LAESGYRHLPVVEDGALLGIISVRDLLLALVEDDGDDDDQDDDDEDEDEDDDDDDDSEGDFEEDDGLDEAE
jgi:hypothetical protein